MSLKFEKKGCYVSLKFAKSSKRVVFVQILNRGYSNFAYKRIQMHVIESKRYLCHYLYIMYYAFSA